LYHSHQHQIWCSKCANVASRQANSARQFSGINISQGSVATRFRCCGNFVTALLQISGEYVSERILNVGHYFLKLNNKVVYVLGSRRKYAILSLRLFGLAQLQKLLCRAAYLSSALSQRFFSDVGRQWPTASMQGYCLQLQPPDNRSEQVLQSARSRDIANSTDLSTIYCLVRVDQTAYRNR